MGTHSVQEAMLFLELWVNASQTQQEVDMKVSLLEKQLFEIKQEKLRNLRRE